MVTSGVFLVLLSLAGCLGVRFNNKQTGRYLLGAYAFFMVLVMIMEFAAAMSIFTFVGKLDAVSPGASSVASDYGMFQLVNISYYSCCCNFRRCPYISGNVTITGLYGGACWIPSKQPYPCDSIDSFKTFLVEYIDEGIQPVAGVALFLCLLQLFTSITACCNQCAGVKQAEKDKIAGSVAYDGLYAEGEEAYASGGEKYGSYVRRPWPRARSGAARRAR
jgi:hypothetical protein